MHNPFSPFLQLITMYPHEALIIYLAAGSPFAVLRYFESRLHQNRATSFVLAAAELILWLPKLAFFGVRRLTKGVNVKVSDNFNHLDAKIRQEVDLFFSSLQSRPGRYSQLAELLEAYVSLGLTLLPDSPETTLQTDFFSAAGRSDCQLAAICLARKNRAKILFHFRRTSQSLLKELTQGPSSKILTPEAIDSLLTIANAFEDPNFESLNKQLGSAARLAA